MLHYILLFASMLVTYIKKVSYYHDEKIWNFDNNLRVNKLNNQVRC